MAFPDTALDILVELLLNGTWTDITTDVRGEEGIVISRGRRGEASQTEPSRCQLTLSNTDGTYSLRNPSSAYYGVLGRNTPIRVSVTHGGETYRRFVGEVIEWPPRWTTGGLDVWVPIEAAGLLRRLGANSPPVRDALRRHVETNSPLAYWPMTEGADARQANEVVGDGPAVRALGVSNSLYQGQPGWSKGTIAPWLDSVAEMTQRDVGGEITARVNYQDTSGWSFDHVRSGTGRSESLNLYGAGEGTTSDPNVRWTITFEQGSDTIEILSNVWDGSTETETTEATITTAGIHDADPHHLRLTVTDDGSSGTDFEFFIDGASAATGNLPSNPTGPLASFTFNWAAKSTSETTESMALGHFTYWGTTPPDAADTYKAMLGHTRELAGRRIERLCAEEGITLRVHGDLAETQTMGPQKAAGVLELMRAAELVDGGVLGEARDELALLYRTGRSRYNQGS